MPKKILHLANWNSTNVGNGALIRGTERLLKEDAPFEIDFVPEAWDDYTFKFKHFDQDFVDLVNQHDALLVNGAVTLNAFRRNTKETGMRFNLPLHLWGRIKKPIIFYGISYRCWPMQLYPNKTQLIKTLEYMVSRENIFFGVRNDGTKDWIRREMGVDSPKIIEVPDPGVFVPTTDRVYPEIYSGRKNICIAFNGEDPVYRFATGAQKMLWKFARVLIQDHHLGKVFYRIGWFRKKQHAVVQKLVDIAKMLDRYYDAQFILIPHYLDDYGMIEDFIMTIKERIAHQRIVTAGILGVPGTEDFYGRYTHADLVLSMRVHSMSPSIGLAVPVIPITSQGRMRNFLNKIDLEDIAVDINNDDFVNVAFEKARSLLADPEPFRKRVKESVLKMRDESRSCNKKIFALLSQSSVDIK